MILPLAIASVAVLAVLAYASLLDVRDRSVPVHVWYPLYIAGSLAVIWYLFTIPSGWGTVAGYAALIATLVYGIELDAKDGKIPPKVMALAVGATALQALAWGYLWIRLGPAALAGFLLLTGGLWTGLELERRASLGEDRVPPHTGWFRFWHIPLLVALQGVAWAALLLAGKGGLGDLLLLLVALYSELFLVFAIMNLFGFADAIALICIALFVPQFPFQPLLGYPPLDFLPFSALTNAVILNLVTPVVIFVMNLSKGNHAPFPYTFFGFPVKGESIEHTYGFVMEEFREKEGGLEREFIPVSSALSQMVTAKRVYTKDLKRYPEKYRKELALYRKAGTVWISYGVPFILPILAGFATALLFGDILFSILASI
ncbi:MAG: peptidase A24 [Methanomicrobiales archaeon]|nr:peptidase A24 [Methanomicrobiales archaeon]